MIKEKWKQVYISIQEQFGKELIREGIKGFVQYSYTENGWLLTYCEPPLAPRFKNLEKYVVDMKSQSIAMCDTLLDRNLISPSIRNEQHTIAHKEYDFNQNMHNYNLDDTYLLAFNIFQYAKDIEHKMKLSHPKDMEIKVSHPNFRFVFRLGLELLQDKYDNHLF
jgi:hypothetical protein